MLLLTPLKLRGPVRTGFASRRATRWVSAAFGVMVLATIAFGVLHSTGIWYGVGTWSALWSHLLLGFALIPLALWHVRARMFRLRRIDLGRRAVLSGLFVAGAAAAAVLAQEAAVRAFGLAGARRGETGSQELSSYDPTAMPVVSWLDDAIPTTDLDAWRLRIDGTDVAVASLTARSRSLATFLDCTGGWRSRQRWDVVPLADVLPERASRSVRVTSTTGYSRLFERADCDRIYLCTGYDGRPLARGHGAPVRIVAPGRRGPWWVKWVTEVELSDQPPWWQPPLPLT